MPNIPISRTFAIALFALLTLIWGTTWAAIQISLPYIPPFRGLAMRLALAAVVLLAVAKWKGIRLGKTKQERYLWLAGTCLTFCISYSIVYWSEQWVPSGLTSVLFATMPLFVALLAQLMLQSEKLHLRGSLGLIFGFLGIVAIFSADFSKIGGAETLKASLILLIAPFVSALNAVFVKKWGAAVHPISLSAVPMGFSAVILMAASFSLESHIPFQMPPVALASVLYLSLMGTALAFYLYYWLLQVFPATKVSLISYLNPVVAVLVGTIFMGETWSNRTLFGAALVLVGVAVAASGNQAQKRSSKS